MKKPRVLYIAHGHPHNQPGGAEAHAYEVYQGMREHGGYEPVFLAFAGKDRPPFPGAMFMPLGEDPNQILAAHFAYDPFYNSMGDKNFYTTHFRTFLLNYRPDIVHFQHTLFLGYEMIREVHRTLPGVPILYTLHEYLPICHHSGLMVTTDTFEPCNFAAPDRCHKCFPAIEPRDFFLRERFAKAHFELVDVFLAPSRFLLEKFVTWGLPREKMCFMEYGRPRQFPEPEKETSKPRGKLGFFGTLSPFKGILLLLESLNKLAQEKRGNVSLKINGANLEPQGKKFVEKFQTSLADTKGNVLVRGPYTPGEIAERMAEVDWVVVPSLWWENSPLVIQEAFAHKRPVICGDIGGMAEKVTDGVNGLHFRAGDATSLSETIHKAINTPGLWERLQKGAPPIFSIQQAVQELDTLYGQLMQEKGSKEHHGKAASS